MLQNVGWHLRGRGPSQYISIVKAGAAAQADI